MPHPTPSAFLARSFPVMVIILGVVFLKEALESRILRPRGRLRGTDRLDEVLMPFPLDEKIEIVADQRKHRIAEIQHPLCVGRWHRTPRSRDRERPLARAR